MPAYGQKRTLSTFQMTFIKLSDWLHRQLTSNAIFNCYTTWNNSNASSSIETLRWTPRTRRQAKVIGGALELVALMQWWLGRHLLYMVFLYLALRWHGMGFVIEHWWKALSIFLCIITGHSAAIETERV